MNSYFWLAVGLAALGFLAFRAGRIWVDTSQRGFGLARRLGWTLLGPMAPSRYWWGARMEALSSHERADLLARETAALGLRRADSLRCPLCGAEVPHAWALASQGRPTVAPGPIACPRCDFRLDSCRHCARFLPGTPQAWGQFRWGGDVTFGRCNHYQASQPVEQACSPEMARRLKASGYERVRAPLPIVDSSCPPTFAPLSSPTASDCRPVVSAGLTPVVQPSCVCSPPLRAQRQHRPRNLPRAMSSGCCDRYLEPARERFYVHVTPSRYPRSSSCRNCCV